MRASAISWPRDRGTLGSTLSDYEELAAAHPRLEIWKIAVLGALLDAGRRHEARTIFEGLVGVRSINLRDNQISLLVACTLAQAAAALDDARRAAVLRRALEPYAGRLAVSGLGGISVGPVSRFAGVAAHASGDLDGAERLLCEAIAESGRHGLRPNEARARRDLALVLAERGGPENEARAADELRIARELADELGLDLGDSHRSLI